MRLSVLMSVRNAGPYLEQALESVLTQLGPEDEFLIRDDGSIDGSREALQLESVQDGKVMLTLGEPLGLAASLNRLLAGARGEFLARMDADDISLPGRFEKQIQELRERRLDLLSSKKARVDEGGAVVPEIVGAPEGAEALLKGFNPFTHGSWMMTRRLVDEGLRYDEGMPSAQDYDYLLRALEHGFKLGVSSEATYHQRVHLSAVSESRRVEQGQMRLLALRGYWERSKAPEARAQRAIVEMRLGHTACSLVHALSSIPEGRWGRTVRELWWHFRNR